MGCHLSSMQTLETTAPAPADSPKTLTIRIRVEQSARITLYVTLGASPCIGRIPKVS